MSLTSLPREILYEVLDLIWQSPEAVVSLQQTCRALREVVSAKRWSTVVVSSTPWKTRKRQLGAGNVNMPLHFVCVDTERASELEEFEIYLQYTKKLIVLGHHFHMPSIWQSMRSLWSPQASQGEQWHRLMSKLSDKCTAVNIIESYAFDDLLNCTFAIQSLQTMFPHNQVYTLGVPGLEGIDVTKIPAECENLCIDLFDFEKKTWMEEGILHESALSRMGQQCPELRTLKLNCQSVRMKSIAWVPSSLDRLEIFVEFKLYVGEFPDPYRLDSLAYLSIAVADYAFLGMLDLPSLNELKIGRHNVTTDERIKTAASGISRSANLHLLSISGENYEFIADLLSEGSWELDSLLITAPHVDHAKQTLKPLKRFTDALTDLRASPKTLKLASFDIRDSLGNREWNWLNYPLSNLLTPLTYLPRLESLYMSFSHQSDLDKKVPYLAKNGQWHSMSYLFASVTRTLQPDPSKQASGMLVYECEIDLRRVCKLANRAADGAAVWF